MVLTSLISVDAGCISAFPTSNAMAQIKTGSTETLYARNQCSNVAICSCRCMGCERDGQDPKPIVRLSQMVWRQLNTAGKMMALG